MWKPEIDTGVDNRDQYWGKYSIPVHISGTEEKDQSGREGGNIAGDASGTGDDS